MGQESSHGRWVQLDTSASRRVLVEWLFLKTIEDIKQRAESQDRYAVLGIAPLLRKLFIDAEPLLQAVRRHRQQPSVGFRFNPFVPKPRLQGPPTWRAVLEYGRDELVGDPDSSRLTAKQFLSASVAAWQGESLSVRDVVKHYSNIEGGVHLGISDSDFSDVVLEIFPPFYDRVPDPVRMLIPIARVAIDGLHELRDDIVSTPFRGPH
jgi:hypothetical protein